jgi:hypothetical protein
MTAMNLLKKLSGLFAAPTRSGNLYPLAVRCNRCGEVIQTQVNLSNDLSVEYDEDEKVTGYFCRKLLRGKQRCFQQIEVTLTFDANHKLIDRKVTGGKFVE